MTTWEGKRKISVVSACLTSKGTPQLVLNQVDVTHEEFENGIHFVLVEDLLNDSGFEEPYFHFDELEAPSFLIEGVKQQVAEAMAVPDLMTEVVPEES
jgi:hypothetical protein